MFTGSPPSQTPSDHPMTWKPYRHPIPSNPFPFDQRPISFNPKTRFIAAYYRERSSPSPALYALPGFLNRPVLPLLLPTALPLSLHLPRKPLSPMPARRRGYCQHHQTLRPTPSGIVGSVPYGEVDSDFLTSKLCCWSFKTPGCVSGLGHL